MKLWTLWSLVQPVSCCLCSVICVTNSLPAIVTVIVFVYDRNIVRSKTLFAPTDTAFQALPAGLLDSLFANPKELVKLLNNHIASGTFYSRGFVSGPLPVVSGITVDVDLSPSKFQTLFGNFVIRLNFKFLFSYF